MLRSYEWLRENNILYADIRMDMSAVRNAANGLSCIIEEVTESAEQATAIMGEGDVRHAQAPVNGLESGWSPLALKLLS